MPGTATLAPEVTHVSKHGFWLLLADEELLVLFDQFPWFRKGTIEQVLAGVGRRFVGAVQSKPILISAGFARGGPRLRPPCSS